MKSYLRYEAIVVGEPHGPIETTFTPDLIEQYRRDWDDNDPRYISDVPDGRRLAPITIDSGRLGADLLWLTFKMDKTVVTKTSQRNLRPVHAGERVRTVGRIEDKYIKRGYEYVVVSYTSYDEAGEPFRTGVDHLLLSLERQSAA